MRFLAQQYFTSVLSDCRSARFILSVELFMIFLSGGVRSKKFEPISPKIASAGGIPPEHPFHSPRLELEAERTISNFSLAVNSLTSLIA
jgi:hypothetical protein